MLGSEHIASWNEEGTAFVVRLPNDGGEIAGGVGSRPEATAGITSTGGTRRDTAGVGGARWDTAGAGEVPGAVPDEDV
ncbi:hypothetical protein Taro_036846 [Colocasia esculenta]|uniref:Uncharacterized protein n=1 Tax=Colocasia esculenta TaxID=4460 RepID=A0A843WJ03_COLES|nr:hypothetical protein [Colocasia esculenta]